MQVKNNSPKTLTLVELVDLALCNPKIGAVNFNVLRILLLQLIKKFNLEEDLAELDDSQQAQVENLLSYIQDINGAGNNQKQSTDYKKPTNSQQGKASTEVGEKQQNKTKCIPQKQLHATNSQSVVPQKRDSNKEEADGTAPSLQVNPTTLGRQGCYPAKDSKPTSAPRQTNNGPHLLQSKPSQPPNQTDTLRNVSVPRRPLPEKSAIANSGQTGQHVEGKTQQLKSTGMSRTNRRVMSVRKQKAPERDQDSNKQETCTPLTYPLLEKILLVRPSPKSNYRIGNDYPNVDFIPTVAEARLAQQMNELCAWPCNASGLKSRETCEGSLGMRDFPQRLRC